MNTKPIGVGIIGTGRISDLHAIEYLNSPKARIVALCDADTALAEQRAKKWNLDNVVIEQELDRLLARTDVDLVEILLPHHLHLDAGLKAINAGKTVSMQKPVGTTMDEADQLVSAAQASDKPFRIFENFIFFPPVMKAKELIRQGAIGEPISVRIKSNSGRSDDAWEVPESATAWRQDFTKSGGGPLVFDDGHHKFALAWHFMGNPVEVHAFIGRTHGRRDEVLDSPSIISFRFPNNRIGNIEAVYSAELLVDTKTYAQDDRIEITGAKGVLWINCGHGSIGNPPPLTLYRDGKVTHYNDIVSDWPESFVLSTRHFLEVLTDGGTPVLTADEARQVLRFSLAAQESARTGRTVELEHAENLF